MKKIIPVIYCVVALLLFSCDKIKTPIVEKSTVVGSNFITKTNLNVSESRKILLEDYTAMKCLNCPRASRTVKNMIDSIYGDELIVLSIHTGGLAQPFAQYKTDFRTNSGDAWRINYGVTSYPSGVINRKIYGANSILVEDTKWTAIVDQAYNQDQFIVKLNVTTNYDPNVGALNTDVDAIFKKNYSKPLKICVVAVEDGLTGVQLDGSVDIEDYEFEHVVRGTINGDWGTDLTTKATKARDTVSVSFKNFDLKNSFKYLVPNKEPKPIVVNDQNVSIVVFAYDATTKEVLQVEKVKIR